MNVRLSHPYPYSVIRAGDRSVDSGHQGALLIQAYRQQIALSLIEKIQDNDSIAILYII